MLAKDCTCKLCQRYAPLYPYYTELDGHTIVQFHKEQREGWNMLTHDQAFQMYCGHPVTV